MDPRVFKRTNVPAITSRVAKSCLDIYYLNFYFTDPNRLDMPYIILIIKSLNYLDYSQDCFGYTIYFLIDKICIISLLLFGFRVCANGTTLYNL